MDFSISWNGIVSAQRSMDQAVRRISAPQSALDAQDMVTVKQAMLSEKANLRVVKSESDREGYLLDLLA